MKKLLILLTIIAAFSSCREECMCPEQGSISFVDVKVHEHISTSLDYLLPMPDYLPGPDDYTLDISNNTISFCSDSGFEISDSTAMVVFSKDTLKSSSDRHYGEFVRPGYYINISTSFITGVVYYQGYFEMERIAGSIPLGGILDLSVSHTDTIPTDHEMFERAFAGRIEWYDEYGLPIYYDYLEDDYLHVPKFYTKTVTSRIYVNNVGLFSEEDFIDNGECGHF